MRFTAILLGLVAASDVAFAGSRCQRSYKGSNGCTYQIQCGERVLGSRPAIYNGTATGIRDCLDTALKANSKVECADYQIETNVCRGFGGEDDYCGVTRKKGALFKAAVFQHC